MSRITVAALAQQIADTNARNEQAFTGIMSVLGSLVEVVTGTGDGQFNTPAQVITQIGDAPSLRSPLTDLAERLSTPEKPAAAPKARKATKKAAAKKAAPAMPEQVREGFAMVRATKEAISPLNKALAVVRKGQPWAKATECSADEVIAALALVVEEHGEDVANAAYDALMVRINAAEQRSK